MFLVLIVIMNNLEKFKEISSASFYCIIPPLTDAFKHIVPLAIWHHLFHEFWLVNTWFFVQPRDQRAVTGLLNIR